MKQKKKDGTKGNNTIYPSMRGTWVKIFSAALRRSSAEADDRRAIGTANPTPVAKATMIAIQNTRHCLPPNSKVEKKYWHNSVMVQLTNAINNIQI